MPGSLSPLVRRDEGRTVARKQVIVSDLSGDLIPDGKGATIRISFADARKLSAVLDMTDEEAEELARKGRKQARRGRRPGTQAAPQSTE